MLYKRKTSPALKMDMIIRVLLAFLFIGFFSCTGDKPVNTESVRKEIKSREAIKITEAEIMSKAQVIGSEIAVTTKQTLGKNLKNALQSGGVENAISFCNLNAMPLVDSLSKKYDADIRRVTLKARNPDDLPTEIEQNILEAYQYQWNDSIPLKENVQLVQGDRYLFTKPILVDNALCLTCHGSSDNGLTQETNEFIKLKYPMDKATGYNLGDLRGMWSISIPKKKIIQSF